MVERGSAVVQRLVGRSSAVATSKVAYAEVHAALARKRREGRLALASYRVALRQFERDWTGWIQVELGDEVLARTRGLVARHPLRGFDAIHLASAVVLRGALREFRTFVAADKGLLSAATREAFETVDVEDSAT